MQEARRSLRSTLRQTAPPVPPGVAAGAVLSAPVPSPLLSRHSCAHSCAGSLGKGGGGFTAPLRFTRHSATHAALAPFHSVPLAASSLCGEGVSLPPAPLSRGGRDYPYSETSCSTLKLWYHSHQKQKAPYCVECFSSRWQVGARSFICVRLAWEHSTCFIPYGIIASLLYHHAPRLSTPCAFFLALLANKASLLPAAQLIGDRAPYKI